MPGGGGPLRARRPQLAQTVPGTAAVGVGELTQGLPAQELGASGEQHREEQDPERFAEGGDRGPGDQGEPDDRGEAIRGAPLLAQVWRRLAPQRGRRAGRTGEPGADHDQDPEGDRRGGNGDQQRGADSPDRFGGGLDRVVGREGIDDRDAGKAADDQRQGSRDDEAEAG